jgi:hypothetical protein
MSDRPPEYITLDATMPSESLNDNYAAEATLPRQIEKRQHALVHGWGGPPVARTVFVNDAGGGKVQYILVRVPPYCRFMRFGVLGTGNGAIHLATTADALGTWLFWNFTLYAGANWVFSSAEIDEAIPVSLDGRCVKVSSTALSTWQTVMITLTVAGGADQGVRGMAFIPMLELT